MIDYKFNYKMLTILFMLLKLILTQNQCKLLNTVHTLRLFPSGSPDLITY